ncbi:hypothetical protein [Frigoriglobus tundricola]|uniref:hypothetical protein n=1 Tax=Frigoriglobus tundricola TaxID=2774151 RepID=UPI00148ED76D|nr:hypothetical protein [Frigoriglobus tundricola]
MANAPFADDLDRHPENDPPAHPKSHPDAARTAETSRLVRGYAADELRNRAAGEALDEFFKLANAEGQFDLLAAADAELRTQLAAALQAERGGLKDRADIPGLRRSSSTSRPSGRNSKRAPARWTRASARASICPRTTRSRSGRPTRSRCRPATRMWTRRLPRAPATART